MEIASASRRVGGKPRAMRDIVKDFRRPPGISGCDRREESRAKMRSLLLGGLAEVRRHCGWRRRGHGLPLRRGRRAGMGAITALGRGGRRYGAGVKAHRPAATSLDGNFSPPSHGFANGSDKRRGRRHAPRRDRPGAPGRLPAIPGDTLGAPPCRIRFSTPTSRA